MTCWFCSIREEDEAKALVLDLYGEVRSEAKDGGTRISYTTRQVRIPRCGDCRHRHRRARIAAMLSVPAILGAATAGILGAWHLASGWVWGILLGFSLGFLLAMALLRMYSLRGIRSVRAARTVHPATKELLDRGYQFGTRPGDAARESAESSEGPRK